MVAILTGVRWNLSVVLICISFMARDGEYYSCVFWPFEFLPLKKFCLVQLTTSLLVHWFGGSLVFWAPCIFWVSVLWCIVGEYCLPLCGWSLQFRDHFFFVQKLFSCSPIFPSFFLVAGLLYFNEEFFAYTYCFKVFSALSCIKFSFRSDIKVLNPLWVDTSTAW
jgi:hypothetical protein